MVSSVDEVKDNKEERLALVPSKLPNENQQLTHHRRLIFWSDNEKVPKDLLKFEIRAIRRRYEYTSHIHALHLKVADITAKLAKETMEREECHTHLLKRSTIQPLASVVDRMANLKDSMPDQVHWSTLARRVEKLDAKITHTFHVQLHDTTKNSLGNLEQEISKTSDEIFQDGAIMNKREGALTRKFEQMAGTMARRFQEESATRYSSIKMLSNQNYTLQELDPQHYAKSIMDEIASLREKLEDERKRRIEADEKIRQRVEAVARRMRTAVASAIPDETEAVVVRRS